MSAFKSPYDREFELQTQEEYKAYQRGFNAGRKSVLDKIRTEIEDLTYYWCEVNPKSVINDVLQIIDKYKEGE